MKPYGNQHWYAIEGLDSTKHGGRPGNRKTSSRRLHKKTRRAKDKASLRNDVSDNS